MPGCKTGGGGSGTQYGSQGSGGPGGSGVVILKFPTTDYSGITTGSPGVVTEGTNTIVGNDPQVIIDAANEILENGGKAGRIPELWDGKTAQRIADLIQKIIEG